MRNTTEFSIKSLSACANILRDYSHFNRSPLE